MRSYLIVANQTLASPTLAAAVAERVAGGDAGFHVVVPASPVHHGGLTWDEDEARSAAQRRLEDVLERLRTMGISATGEVGCKDPVDAIHDALRGREIDEIILSTLPVRVSRWLGQDVPSKLRRTVEVPVVVVIAPDEPAAVAAESGSNAGTGEPDGR
jgi:nucleotide-binding universal stress UspA family protein